MIFVFQDNARPPPSTKFQHAIKKLPSNEFKFRIIGEIYDLQDTTPDF